MWRASGVPMRLHVGCMWTACGLHVVWGTHEGLHWRVEYHSSCTDGAATARIAARQLMPTQYSISNG